MPRHAAREREQLPHTPCLCEAVLALGSLREAYKQAFDPGRKEGRRWARCIDAHRAAQKTLEDPELLAAVAERVQELHRHGNGAPDQALSILNGTHSGQRRIEQLERCLGRGAGFSDAELTAFCRNARRSLKRAARKGDPALPHITDGASLEQHLQDIHSLAGEVLFAPLSMPARAKDAERARAWEQIDGRLYLMISVISNSDHPDLFNFSYAAGLGAAAHRGARRKRLPAASKALPLGVPTPAPSTGDG